MTTYTLNQVIETLAPVIAQKNDYRAIIDYTNGDTVLLDFSACGEPFGNDAVMVWTYQRDIIRDGEYQGTEEVDYGTYDDYLNAFKWVELMLNNYLGNEVKDFYIESF